MPAWGGLQPARLADVDLFAAIARVTCLPEGQAKLTALLHLFYRWEQTDPDGLADFIQNLPAGYEQLQSLMASRWAGRDPSAAARWVEGLPVGAGRDQAVIALAASWSEVAPVEAATYASGLPSGPGGDGAVAAVVASWARRDPAATALWVEVVAEGELRENCIRDVTSSWAKKDMLGAAKWVCSLNDEADCDTGLAALSRVLKENYPAFAFECASMIAEEGLRNKEMALIGRAWLSREPARAMTVIAESQLPAGAKIRLVSRIP